jgi:outer membrane receptor protein involved in Fe transport
MKTTLHLRSALALGVSAMALVIAAPALAQTTPPPASTGAITDIVVTAQRRSEAIQDVPVAVSAFSADTLKAQRLDGGDKLLLEVPNVNYSRGNFGGYNFQIRGIGTKSVAPSGDPGVSFNINNLPVTANHLGDTDFYDVERVEVLRGPQGTLYGRSATGGAVNVIYAKPNDRYSASITGEYGNFNTEKVNGYVNFPIGDTLAVRLAGFYLKRDGFGKNSVTGNDIDNRDLGSYRGTISWKPTDNFRATLMYEHFSENDNRNRVGKQLCVKDPNTSSIGGVPLSSTNAALLNQGCIPGSLYSDAAYGTVNSNGTLSGVLSNLVGLTSGNDVFATHPFQNHNLHDIESAIDPTYTAKENLAILNLGWDITNNLTLESITGYNSNKGTSGEDYNRLVATTPFNTVPNGAAYSALVPLLFPGGVIKDPQVGSTNLLRSFDYGDTRSIEKTEEIRLTSSFKGPLNFAVGGIYIDNSALSNYYVESNPLTAYAQVQNFLAGSPNAVYVDPAQIPTGIGHNYYDSRSDVSLKSTGYFGELYWTVNDELKVTAGVRQTEDRKKNAYYPIELLAAGSGFPSTLTQQSAKFNATTGRFNIDWTPHLSFTNKTLFYASYSRGYQGGGFNTPAAAGTISAQNQSPTFAPVYVDAYELGTKNVLLDGALVLNGDIFYYKEKGYQISSIVNKSSVNSNIDANIYGAELESLWSPIRNLTLNANIGYLHTEITSGNVLDQSNLTQGNPNLTVVKASDGSNCVVPTAAVATLVAIQEGLPGTPNIPGVTGSNPTALLGACSGALAALGVVPSAGVPVNLSGKELPNSPEFTVSLGAQYVMDFGPWRSTARVDYYWQDSSYARIFNTVSDQLRSYDNVNATLTFDRRDWGLNVQLYIKNAFDKQPITDTYLTDASSGLFTNVFTLDPRTYGVSVTKKF